MTKEQFKALEARAKSGDPVAAYDLGVAYQRGDSVKADLKRAVVWWKKSAEAWYALAEYNLGVAYQRGLGVKEDEKLAVRYYTSAAEKHFGPAEYNLGFCYYNGTGVERDPKRALYWWNVALSHGFQKAAEAIGKFAARLMQADEQRAQQSKKE